MPRTVDEIISPHAPRRRRLVIGEHATVPLPQLTDKELRSLDRALVAVSVDPDAGVPVAGTQMLERRCGSARVVYFVTRRGTILVMYAEA